jgi:hypothetical protein
VMGDPLFACRLYVAERGALEGPSVDVGVNVDIAPGCG